MGERVIWDIDFRVLGPVELRVGGRVVAAGPQKRRALLALLLLRAGELVPVETIAEELWDGEPPASALSNIRTYLAGIRAGLPAAERDRVVCRAGGYLLRTADEELDAAVFARLAERGRTALTAGNAGTAAAEFERALGLWRGAVAEDVSPGPTIGARRTALAEQRQTVREDWFTARLALGATHELVPDLREMIAADPVRERGWALLMTALYRGGDPAAALRAFGKARDTLVDRLGIEPGPELQQLHRAVLSGDPRAGAAHTGPVPVPAASTAASADRPVPRELPLDVAQFAGRAAELAALDGLAATGAVVAIDGTAGVGKTALAVHWAHRVHDRFPGGQLYVNLRGYGPGGPVPPEAALDSMLRALGTPPQRIPADLDARAALWRDTLAGRKVLVVLDNARDSDQVRPLLPPAGCLALVTSRNQLRGLVAAHGAHRLSLDRLPSPDAAALLTRTLGPDRLAGWPPDTVTGLIERCQGLPLALRIVAERAARRPGLTPAELVGQLRGEPVSLDQLTGHDGPSTDLRTVFWWSYQALDPDSARLFRLFGLHPGEDLSVPAAAALADLPPRRAGLLLDRLAAAHLLEERRTGRYSAHDLLRAYAAERAGGEETTAGRRAALTRLLDWYLHTANNANRLLQPTRPRDVIPPPAAGTRPLDFAGYRPALGWFEAEHRTLLAAVPVAAGQGLDGPAWQLAWVLWSFLALSQRPDNWLELYRTALAAACRTGDQHAEAHATNSLGIVHSELGLLAEAADYFGRALELYTGLGEEAAQARALDNIAVAHCRLGRFEEAVQEHRRALELDRRSGDSGMHALHLNNLAVADMMLGRHRDAIGYAREAVAMSYRLGGQRELAQYLDTLGEAHSGAGEQDRAVTFHRQALELYRYLGDRRGEAAGLTGLGHALAATGKARAADRAWREALAILLDLGDPRTAELRDLLATPSLAGAGTR